VTRFRRYFLLHADTVIPRGLALFPQSADLLALNAKELRAHGKIAESREYLDTELVTDVFFDGARPE